MKCFDPVPFNAPLDAAGLYIHILKFLALIVNLWFVLWATRDLGAPLGGWIQALCPDNTFTLSWL
jgi:hypothetical protein